MKIAYNHLLRFLVDKPSIGELSEKLFQLGHEHEIVDLIFDMEFTPNRGDCLSLCGLARDLNVFYETNLEPYIFEEPISDFDLNFINNSPVNCSSISFLNIEIKEHKIDYKDYLENYFTDLKINKNNFFTDISNYIGYEMGQPTHSYDLHKLGSSPSITLHEIEEETNFLPLLGKELKLKHSDLAFSNNNKVINLAGIMGGIETSCDQGTKNALVECAYFKPESVIGRAIKYDLHSDASHKFERGVDPLCHEKILRRFIEIVRDHAQIIKLEIFTSEENIPPNISLEIDLDRINKILGTNINMDIYTQSLSSLGFLIDKKITVPSFRSDINHQNDLAEELARVIGYNNILSQDIKLPETIYRNNFIVENKIKSFLIDNGFYEVINSPFVAINNKDSIKVDNPLDSNKAFLRTNIIDSLVNNMIFNERRQKDSIKFFEISDIYSSKDGGNSSRRIAIIASGRVDKNYQDFSKKLDINYLLSVFAKLGNIKNLDFKIVSRSNLDSKIKSPVVFLEIDIDQFPLEVLKYEQIFNEPVGFNEYKPISEFPSTYRDISYSIDDYSKMQDLQDIILGYKDDFIKDIFIFDFFENTKMNVIKIGFRIVFQSTLKTLTDEDVTKIISKIIQLSCNIEGINIPGIQD